MFVQENRHRWNFAWLRPARVGGTARNGIYSMWSWDNPTPRGDGQRWGQEYTSIHEGGGNLLFVDGHAEYRKHADLRARDFGLTGGNGVGGKPDDPSTTFHTQTYYSMFQ